MNFQLGIGRHTWLCLYTANLIQLLCGQEGSHFIWCEVYDSLYSIRNITFPLFSFSFYTFFIIFPDCIGSEFNVKGAMQCPNCRATEDGQWLFVDDDIDESIQDEDEEEEEEAVEMVKIEAFILFFHFSLSILEVGTKLSSTQLVILINCVSPHSIFPFVSLRTCVGRS